MNRWKRYVSVLWLFAALVPTAAAQELGSIEGTERTVGFGISEMENALFRSIVHSGTRYSETKHEAAMAAHLLLLNWKAQYRGLLETPFARVKAPEQAAYTQLRTAINDAINAIGEESDAQARTVVPQLEAALAEIPARRNQPRLHDITPTLLMDPEAVLTVEIEGTGLDRGNPVAVVDTLTLAPTLREDNRLHFEVPLEVPGEGGIRFTSFDVFAGRRPQLLFFGQEVGPERFGIVLPVLPSTLATIAPINVTSTTTDRNTRQRSRLVTCEVEEAGSVNQCNVTISAEADWRIDTSSPPRLVVNESRDPNDAASVGSVAGDGFGVNLAVYRSRRPGSPRGRVAATVTWDEFREVSRVVSEEIQPNTRVLRWGEPVTLQLPAGLDSFSLRITGFDGSVHHYDRNMENYLAAVQYDPASGRLTIQPRTFGGM